MDKDTRLRIQEKKEQIKKLEAEIKYLENGKFNFDLIEYEEYKLDDGNKSRIIRAISFDYYSHRRTRLLWTQDIQRAIDYINALIDSLNKLLVKLVEEQKGGGK